MNTIPAPESPLSIRLTTDGSSTLYSSQFNETYHSIHGALAESMHVFIKEGLHEYEKQSLNIFEVGFGTGLNALLTLLEAEKRMLNINYHSIEKFPVDSDLITNIQLPEFSQESLNIFSELHSSSWEQKVDITSFFKLHKIKGDLLDLNFPENLDLVYFDAFSPESQPELWSEKVFQRLYDNMNSGGIIVTYCAKGVVRRTLRDIGFRMERLAGPPPKREMLRGRK